MSTENDLTDLERRTLDWLLDPQGPPPRGHIVLQGHDADFKALAARLQAERETRREYVESANAEDLCECGHARHVHNPEEESCWFCPTGHPFRLGRK